MGRPGRTWDDVDDILSNGYVIDDNGCYIWQGKPGPKGYGYLSIENKTVEIYKLAYILWVDDVPLNKDIRHTCNVRLCYNPDHLVPGTRSRNLIDLRDSKGCNNQKLTIEKAREIRTKLQDNCTIKQLAEEYNVSEVTISKIKHNRTWKEV